MNRIQQLLQMLEEDPSDQFLQYALALEYHKLGEGKKAIDMLKRLSDDYLPKYYQLGKLFEEHLQLEEALEIYRKGENLARKVGDLKTANELAEAIWMLD